MMRKTWAGAVVLVLVGCGGSQTKQGAQADLNRAELEAAQKAEEAERQAARDVEEARAKAAREMAEADAAFERTRADYRSKVRDEIAEIDDDIAELENKAWKGTTKAKANTDLALSVVREKRSALLRDAGRIDTATVGEWDAVKANIDFQLESLKRSVDDAEK